jgi:hypothetical protein
MNRRGSEVHCVTNKSYNNYRMYEWDVTILVTVHAETKPLDRSTSKSAEFITSTRPVRLGVMFALIGEAFYIV